ncbi:MAG: hypothetical protein IPH53_21935 [Flavobacteriales bacterium]|nr:hypothetical protein [Flavobacteriales bacterium]
MSTRAWAYLLLFIAVFATAWQLLRYPQDPAPIRVAVLVETPTTTASSCSIMLLERNSGRTARCPLKLRGMWDRSGSFSNYRMMWATWPGCVWTLAPSLCPSPYAAWRSAAGSVPPGSMLKRSRPG